MPSITLSTLAELASFASRLREANPDVRLFLLHGDLGSGKTAFVNAFCKILGVGEEVSSPTFGIVNTYKSGKSEVFHFDLYRVKDEAELEEMGFQEYLDRNAWVFIEWPEVGEFYDGPRVSIEFEILPTGERMIQWELLDD